MRLASSSSSFHAAPYWFAAIYPLYGVVVAAVADGIAPPWTNGKPRGLGSRAAQAILFLLTVVAAVATAADVRRTYFG